MNAARFECFPFGGVQHARAALHARQQLLRACLLPGGEDGADLPTAAEVAAGTAREDGPPAEGDAAQSDGAVVGEALAFEGGTLPPRAAAAAAAAADPSLARAPWPAGGAAGKGRARLIGKAEALRLARRVDPIAAASPPAAASQRPEPAGSGRRGLAAAALRHARSFRARARPGGAPHPAAPGPGPCGGSGGRAGACEPAGVVLALDMPPTLEAPPGMPRLFGSPEEVRTFAGGEASRWPARSGFGRTARAGRAAVAP
jgi:hypothetical protein